MTQCFTDDQVRKLRKEAAFAILPKRIRDELILTDEEIDELTTNFYAAKDKAFQAGMKCKGGIDNG